jgi:hypothetical protein
VVRDRAAGSDADVLIVAPALTTRLRYLLADVDEARQTAEVRLRESISALGAAGVQARGAVGDSNPLQAMRDALCEFEPDEIIVSTHPEERSGWWRRKVIDRVRDAAEDVPVEHIVVDLNAEGDANVLVLANETVVGDPLLDRIRERAARSPASFLIVCPQSDPNQGEHPEAERRLRRALTILRAEGIDVHGQVAHPDPYSAARQAVHDERVDEIIVSTFAPERSPWMRKNLVERLQKDTGLPVEHVVLQEEVAAR